MKTKIIDIRNLDEQSYSNSIQEAGLLLKTGEVIAFPTETVYGLGGIISSKETIDKIYFVKGRPADNPLIVHCSSPEQLFSLCKSVFPLLELLVRNFMPGPLTIVTKKSPKVADFITSGLDTIALRIPSKIVAIDLINEVGVPIAAPSANLSGKPSPTHAQHVMDDFNGKIPMILDDGDCDIGIESTVILVEENQITLLRPGIIEVSTIEHITNIPVTVSVELTESILSPGMKYRHYSPNAIVRLFYDKESYKEAIQENTLKSMLLIPENSSTSFENASNTFRYSEHNLYALFRLADEQHYSQILLFIDDSTAKKMGLMNRIKKAASK
ncbi:MAG: threonylcarbamoyl-AMP synthase [Candidatus Kapabacteria bacterium]|jgi:L-threonylcarbamoyladenylate synthase|nr:threonylcarbamoyl-AMP synthase [Candidatus Kapabacteria bacterium]